MVMFCVRCLWAIREGEPYDSQLRQSPSGPGTTVHLHRRCLPHTVPCAPCVKARIFGTDHHHCRKWAPGTHRVHRGRATLKLNLRNRPQPCPCTCRTRTRARART
ncbi:hypothetical protein ACFV0R_17750 [Streptomyces sp. NPDC059578]|uniref:hypothetical protein n=1 Tax=unclassified Streptomyces TaxID=2593676 RepID=UPI00364EB1AB